MKLNMLRCGPPVVKQSRDTLQSYFLSLSVRCLRENCPQRGKRPTCYCRFEITEQCELFAIQVTVS
jgi:hypothetical protein